MTYIPARPTTYRGIQMRSRLEAKYAQAFDEMGTEWIYEPRAFAGRGGQYLPDFWVRDGDREWYLEVKPTLELAYPALSKMQIIRESLPSAQLEVAVDFAGFWYLWPWRDGWTWTPWKAFR